MINELAYFSDVDTYILFIKSFKTNFKLLEELGGGKSLKVSVLLCIFIGINNLLKLKTSLKES